MLEGEAPNVLFLGPVPPPIGGVATIFVGVLEAWEKYTGVKPHIINTSPGRIKRDPGVGLRDLVRGAKIITELLATRHRYDAILLISTTGLIVHLSNFLQYINKKTPVFIWVGGGTIHEDFGRMPARKQKRLLARLARMSGIFVETGLVKEGLADLGLHQVSDVPNPRAIDWSQLPSPGGPPYEGTLRLAYYSRIVEDKGVFLLVDAMKDLLSAGVQVTCDIYGPIDPSAVNIFPECIEGIEGIRYQGMREGDATGLLSGYHAIVLPTWFSREGHPGILVESMMAGVPVITTDHMAIPEVVTHDVNGILVAPRSKEALVEAVRKLAEQPDKARTMGIAHRDLLSGHDTAQVVSTLCGRIQSLKEAYST